MMSTDTEIDPKRSAAISRPVQDVPANPLRKAMLVVVALVAVLFGVSVVMERLTPSSSQAVVQAYVVRTAPEVAGRDIEVNITDNARVGGGRVLFRINPRPHLDPDLCELIARQLHCRSSDASA